MSQQATTKRFNIEPAILISAVVGIVVLCGALLDKDSLGESLFGQDYNHDWPYGYYTFLRYVVCISSVTIGVMAYDRQSIVGVWMFLGQSILYNPLVPVHLTVETWTVWNLVAIVFYVVGIFLIQPVKIFQPLEATND